MKGKLWKVITGLDEYKAGDFAIFFEIDSFLPADDEHYAFLRKRCLRKFCTKSRQVLREGIRIKSYKLRGELSQGLLMPISSFGDKIIGYTELDTDLTELLHVENYDEIREQMALITGTSCLAAEPMGKFPEAYAPKSDETRIQILPEYFETMKGRKFEVSVKFDGTSTSIAYSPTIDEENPFVVCSRNLRVREFSQRNGKVSIYWLMARKYDIENKLKAFYEATGNEWMLQLESVGCGINGNADRYTDNQMFCFRIWDIKKQCFVAPAVRRQFCKDNNIPHVDVIAEEMSFFDVITTMDEALKFAEGKTSRGNEREGVVLKSCDDGPFVSLKIVSNKYLLGEK